MSTTAEIPEMVERVAWALMLAEYGPGDRDPMLDYWWEKYADTYREHASIAIEAMREPTDRMADKGESSLICGPLPDDLETSPSFSWAHAKSCWRAMIDEALVKLSAR